MPKPDFMRGLDPAWEHVGEIGVDSGTIMVGDPCLHIHDCKKPASITAFNKDWDTFCKAIKPEITQIGQHHAVVVSGFGGDGVFPVLVKRNAQTGLIEEMLVMFR